MNRKPPSVEREGSAAPPFSEGAGRKAHLVGACGAGMRALAEYLVDAGWRVSGSDRSPSPRARAALQAAGIEVSIGHAANHLSPDVDLVVHSAAVPDTNVERAAAAAYGIADLSYPQTLGRLIRGSRAVAVAGTHGKTTTTAMLGWILREAGWNPSVICGGELRALNRSGWRGRGDLFVLEACEYGRHFLELRPHFAALLNLEPDHFDSYPDINAAVCAYREFLASVAADGAVVIGETPLREQLAGASRSRIESCGFDALDHWCATDVRTGDGRVTFELRHGSRLREQLQLSHPGRHNVANASAAAALALQIGVPLTAVRDALRSFPGVWRRFQIACDDRGVVWVDDYAHHPTAVRSVLSAARSELGAARIWCAFQPHQISRTNALMGEFVSALAAADEVLLTPVYAAREPRGVDSQRPSRTMVRQLLAAGRSARFVPTLDRIVATLETEPRPGDVIVVLGAGDMERVCHERTGPIRRDHAP